MTVWDVGAALRRRWLVTIVGVVLTLLAVSHLAKTPGVYWSQVNVLFLLPVSNQNPNSLQFQSDSLISLAGIVAKASGSDSAGSAPTSDGVTLVGEGIYNGHSIRLPNTGSQWIASYTKPLLDVQASGPSPEVVVARMTEVIGQINAELERRQAAEGVAPTALVTTRLSPPEIPVYYSNGSRIRAMAATTLLGLGLTCAFAVVVDRRRSRRRRGSTPDAPASVSAPVSV